MSEEQPQKESYVDEAKRRIAHLSYKLEQAQDRIKVLEHDNADLVRWTNDICLPRLQELTDELVNKYNQKKYRSNKTDYKWRKGREETEKKAPGCRHTVGGGSGRTISVANRDNAIRQRWYSGTYPKGDGVTLVNQD